MAASLSVGDRPVAADGDAVTSPALVVIRVCSGSQHEAYAQELCVCLNQFAGIASVLCVTESDSTGGRSWLRESQSLVQRAAVFAPIVDDSWFATEEGLLELCFALRRSIHTGEQPVVLPLVCPHADELEKLWSAPDSPLGDLGPTLENVVALLPVVKGCAFHQLLSDTPKQIAIRIVNFMMALDFPVRPEAPSVATGSSTVEAYIAALGSDRRPNSGLLRALATQADGQRVPAKAAALGGTQAVTIVAAVAAARPTGGPANCKQLLLSRLYFADLGTVALAAVLPMLPRLTVIDLSGNGVNNRGVGALCAAFRYHPSIEDINLSNNLLSIPAAADLVLLLRENRRIVRLDVRDNFIQSDVWERRIAQELAANQQRAERRSQLGRSTAMSASVDLSSGPPQLPPHVRAATVVAATIPKSPGAGPSATPTIPPLSMWHVTLRATASGSLVAAVTVKAAHPATNNNGHQSQQQLLFDAAATLDPTATTAAAAGSSSSNAGGSSSGATRKIELERDLVAAVQRYTSGFIDLHSVTFTRVNGKALRFVLEGAVQDGLEDLLLGPFLSWLQQATAASSKIPSAIVRGEQRLIVRLECCHDNSSSDYFVEMEMGLFGLRQRLYKSLVQVFRAADITRSSGNMADELAALAVLMVSQQGHSSDSAEPSSGEAGSSAAAAAVRSQVQFAEDATAQSVTALSNMQAKQVVSAWGRAAVGVTA